VSPINCFDKSSLDYVSESAMIQWQKTLCLRLSRWLWGCSYGTRIAYSISGNSMEFRSLSLLCIL